MKTIQETTQEDLDLTDYVCIGAVKFPYITDATLFLSAFSNHFTKSMDSVLDVLKNDNLIADYTVIENVTISTTPEATEIKFYISKYNTNLESL